MNDGWTFAVATYIVVAVLFAVGFGVNWYTIRDIRSLSDEARRDARLTLASPVWPLIALVYLVRGLTLIIRDAFGGDR